ncbi:MAG: ribosome biogenesis GTPase Der [Deltaproteobacteria bacterium]|nr:ribosome biogenesis GTPase Der [Deltaproteobacteria bacterium]
MIDRRNQVRRPAGSVRGKPLVAIVGRPNVGKSTLFNRLVGQRIAIVEDVPGVTRDRHYADAFVLGREFVLIDTGGFDPDSDDPMKAGITSKVRLALEECDLVICVVDATVDPLPADREAVALLRDAGKPVIFVANKADSEQKSHTAGSYYELGLSMIMPISALHGRGIGDLEDAIADQLPEVVEESGPDLEVPRVAIIGRPNAGKSSLVNQLCGEERQIVDNRPGTTVDSVDTLVERDGKRLILIDTAGIRRKRSVHKRGVEALSVLQAIRSIERSDIVVLMIDAEAGVGEQDAKIAGLANDRGRALILALNKVDLLSREEQKKAMDRTREILAFVPWAPLVTVSALRGSGVSALLGRIEDAVTEHRKRITTAELNRFFEEVLDRHPPPTMHHRAVRLYYITQVSAAPPTLVIMTNEPKGVHFSYQRYVVNQIRKRFGFRGTPIRVHYRGKKKRGK